MFGIKKSMEWNIRSKVHTLDELECLIELQKQKGED